MWIGLCEYSALFEGSTIPKGAVQNKKYISFQLPIVPSLFLVSVAAFLEVSDIFLCAVI